MSKISLKSIFKIVFLAFAVSITLSAVAADNTDLNDTAELKNGDKVTGILLTDRLTVSSPYSLVTLEKDKISEININSESGNHDVIILNAGGIMEGTIEETGFLFKPVNGENITLKKEECKRIILKRKE